jgi:pyruvate, water dikinase
MTVHMTQLANVSDIHGGKARGLRLLIDGGFRVPPGLALSEADVHALGVDHSVGCQELDAWLRQADTLVAVRSSALVEDGAAKSYAGMFDSQLDVKPRLIDVLQAIEAVSMSGTSARVHAYTDQVTSGVTARIPVIIQRMVRPRISGVTFTAATATDGGDCLYIEWVEGLGEQLVSGKVTPSRITLPWHRSTGLLDRSAVVLQGGTPGGADLTSLCDAFDRLRAVYPGEWDVEWSIDDDGHLWLLQLRPITRPALVPATDAHDGFRHGAAASPGRAEGAAFIVDDDGDTDEFADGDVLIAEITEVEYVPAMRRAAAIVTEQGGMLSHAAIVARELGKPCVVGLTGARTTLRPGTQTVVDGTAGTVQQGKLTLGSAYGDDIDWRSVCFYDRGLEVSADGLPFYVESLPTGLTAYTADDIAPARLPAIQRALRQQFRHHVDIVADQKLLWFREWQRFNQLAPVAALQAMLTTAIARWDDTALETTIQTLKTIAAESAHQRYESRAHELYLRELGAALHSLCGVAVEGIGAWASYRDTMQWCRDQRISFNSLLTTPADAPHLPDRIRRILRCVTILSELRNTAYPYFIETGAFTLEYFQNRADLVAAVCQEFEMRFEDETRSLNQLYHQQFFTTFDPAWHKLTLTAMLA